MNTITFPGHVKPVREGLYKRKWAHGWMWAWWDNTRKVWRMSWSSKRRAVAERIASPHQPGRLRNCGDAIDWRGLAEKS